MRVQAGRDPHSSHDVLLRDVRWLWREGHERSFSICVLHLPLLLHRRGRRTSFSSLGLGIDAGRKNTRQTLPNVLSPALPLRCTRATRDGAQGAIHHQVLAAVSPCFAMHADKDSKCPGSRHLQQRRWSCTGHASNSSRRVEVTHNRGVSIIISEVGLARGHV